MDILPGLQAGEDVHPDYTLGNQPLHYIWAASLYNGPESLASFYSESISDPGLSCQSIVSPPACQAPASHTETATGAFIPTGCAGAGEIRGTLTTTTTQTRYTCPGPTPQTQTTATTQTITRSSTTNCQTTQDPIGCVADTPGYAYAKTCLLFNGSLTNCGTPHVQYDPVACPVPVPAN